MNLNKKLTKKEFYNLCYRMYFDSKLKKEIYLLQEHFMTDKWPLNFHSQCEYLNLKPNQLRVMLKLLGYKIVYKLNVHTNNRYLVIVFPKNPN
jgi:hypothetical protein